MAPSLGPGLVEGDPLAVWDSEEAKKGKGGGGDAERARAMRRLATATLRGALLGGCLRGGFTAFSAMRRRKGKRQEAVLEALRWAGFMGAYSGVFVGVDEYLGHLLGFEATSAWRTALAGLLAGPTILITGLGRKEVPRQNSLSLYLFLRAVLLLLRVGNKTSSPPIIRRALAVTRWQHADTACMCIASSQILYSWIMMPHTLPRSYVSFLNKHGGHGTSIPAGIRVMASRGSGNPVTDSAILQRVPKIALDPDVKIPCEFLHPGQSCAGHKLSFLLKAYLRSVPVYIPVYLIPALLVHRAKIWKEPGSIAARTALGVARSSLFLSCYCQFAWASVCTTHQLTGVCNGYTVASSAGAGLSTLIEKKSRRVELAVYVLSRAIESFFLCMTEWKYIPRGLVKQRADIWLFSVSSAIILHCYTRERDIFREKYLNCLDWMYGNSGHKSHQIAHVPSYQLLAERPVKDEEEVN